MLKLPVYLDNHSTTPVDRRVLDDMLPYFNEKFGNAASRNHAFGWEAEAAVDQAREEIARLIHSSPREIVFTSGATESDNLAIKGAAEAGRDRGDQIVTCATEHRAVLDSCKALQRQGFKVTFLPVDRAGRLDLERLRAAVNEKTILVSLMAANNEIGTIHPLKEIGRIAKEKNVIFHCDAAQAVGKITIDVEEMGIDLLSISAHKMYGPKGIGALYVRSKGRKIKLKPIIDGGGHERGLRSGTLNVPGIVGMGKACALAQHEMAGEAKRLTALRERLKDGLLHRLDEVYVNGESERLPGNMNLSFAYIEGESLMMALKDIALSTGSACTSASLEPSHVLRALGLDENLIHASIRFGIGRFNTEEEIDYTIERVAEEVTRLRKLSPLYEAARRDGGKRQRNAETVS
ncbi:MAG TPA: IscS subfamily cysteine desulfurase [Verrucomicrobiae bacterium]|jgi:cysteine desulfurase|nr:IscS subfamily cysteine desulfurase [Verrucomicrobiae bacterium]